MPTEWFKKWVPEEIKATLSTSEESQHTIIQDTYVYEPTLFTENAKSPYVNGDITPLGNGYILLSLYSM